MAQFSLLKYSLFFMKTLKIIPVVLGKGGTKQWEENYTSNTSCLVICLRKIFIPIFLGFERIQSAEPDNNLSHSGAVHMHGPGSGILGDQVF